ncbi:MAG: hypothetical protein BGO39_12480 [Chloroflexi bacterium 54-19]|nr:MAG: hypothetical protein BGO39_12480 [Chloroflexi bacterium 54-19]
MAWFFAAWLIQDEKNGIKKLLPIGRSSFFSKKLVTAGADRAAAICGVEGLAARATRNRVRVMDGEAATHQLVYKVNLGPFEIFAAELVHVYFQAIHIVNFVAVADFIFQDHLVLETAATAPGYEDPQTEVRVGFFSQNSLKLYRRFLRQGNHLKTSKFIIKILSFAG